MNLSPPEQIKACDFVIAKSTTTDRVRSTALRLKKQARTEQLKQECAPMMKLQSERRV